MPLSAKSLAGPGYIILNTIRAMNVVGLLAIICASIMMLVRTVIESQFFFFDAVSHVITVCISAFLIISELCLFRTYFTSVWPILSPSHGFVGLGCGMLILGVDVLGNLNKPATTQAALGVPIWRIVISSGVIVLILGFLNILASYIFRDRPAGITARTVRAKGAVAVTEREVHAHGAVEVHKAYSVSSGEESGSSATMHDATHAESEFEHIPTPVPQGGRSRNTWSFLRMNFRGEEHSSLPSYYLNSPSPSSRYSVRTGVRELTISKPLAVNPQFAHLVRPDLVYRPSRA